MTFYGFLLFLVFNGLVILALIAHVRASIVDPGEIPKDIEIPDYVDESTLKCCEKGTCKMNWKPQRAHHCSECELCVFKVSFDSKEILTSFLFKYRWTIIALG